MAGIKVCRRLLKYQSNILEIKANKGPLPPPPPLLTNLLSNGAFKSSISQPFSPSPFMLQPRIVDLFFLRERIEGFIATGFRYELDEFPPFEDLKCLVSDEVFKATESIHLPPLKFDFSDIKVKCPWIISDPETIHKPSHPLFRNSIAPPNRQSTELNKLSKGDKVIYYNSNSCEGPELVSILSYSPIDGDFTIQFESGRERHTIRDNLRTKSEFWDYLLKMPARVVAGMAIKLPANRRRKEIFNHAEWGNCAYEGELNEKGMRHGLGICSYSIRKSVTEGMWRDGRLHGKNVERWENGQIFEGEYVDDMREGYGVYTWPGVAVYEGHWRLNKRQGQGVMRFNNGFIQEGEWDSGVFNKPLTYRWSIKACNSMDERQIVDWIDKNGNIMFHFNPRLIEEELVMNTCYTTYEKDRCWASEERIRLPRDILSGTPLEVTVEVTSAGYKVYFGDHSVHLYRHRIPFDRFVSVVSSPNLSVSQVDKYVDKSNIADSMSIMDSPLPVGYVEDKQKYRVQLQKRFAALNVRYNEDLDSPVMYTLQEGEEADTIGVCERNGITRVRLSNGYWTSVSSDTGHVYLIRVQNSPSVSTAIDSQMGCDKHFSENGDRVLFVPYPEIEEMKAINRDIYKSNMSKSIVFDRNLKVWIIPANSGINEDLFQKWLTPSYKWIKMNRNSPFRMQMAIAKSGIAESATSSEDKEIQGSGLSNEMAINDNQEMQVKQAEIVDTTISSSSTLYVDRLKTDNDLEYEFLPLAFATSDDTPRRPDPRLGKSKSVCTVIMRDLDCRIFDKRQLEIVCSPFGSIVSMELERDATSEQKLTARVLFEGADAAINCVKALDGKRFDRFKISFRMN